MGKSIWTTNETELVKISKGEYRYGDLNFKRIELGLPEQSHFYEVRNIMTGTIEYRAENLSDAIWFADMVYAG